MLKHVSTNYSSIVILKPQYYFRCYAKDNRDAHLLVYKTIMMYYKTLKAGIFLHYFIIIFNCIHKCSKVFVFSFLVIFVI